MSNEAFEGVSSCSMQDACHRKPNIGLTNQNSFCNSMAEHQSIKSDGPSLRFAVPSTPPPPQMKQRRGNFYAFYANLTLTVFRDVTLLQEII